MTKTYTATAAREGRWWVLTVDGVGVTQVRALRDAPDMARDLVATMLDVDPADVVVDVIPELDPATQAAVDTAQRLVRHLDEQQRKAARASREAVAALNAAGLNGADTAAVLGVSPQRVSQLAAGAKVARQATTSALATHAENMSALRGQRPPTAGHA